MLTFAQRPAYLICLVVLAAYTPLVHGVQEVSSTITHREDPNTMSETQEGQQEWDPWNGMFSTEKSWWNNGVQHDEYGHTRRHHGKPSRVLLGSSNSNTNAAFRAIASPDTVGVLVEAFQPFLLD